MRICFRDINRKIYSILDIIVSKRSKPHQIRPTASALHHVADCFLIKLRLCQDTDHKGAVLDQGNGAMLQLTSCICLRMDVADLLHLKAALKADGIINPSSDKKDILCIGLLGGKPLTPFLILDQLCTVRLGGRNRDLRSCKCVEYMIRLSCNGRAHHIDNSQRADPLLLTFPKRSQTVRSLTGLTDDHCQAVRIQKRLPVTELRSKLHTHRKTCQILDHILCSHSHMICRTTCNNINLVNVLNIFICKSDFRKIDLSVFHNRTQSVLNCFRLLMDLLHHEMLKTGFLRRLCIPLNDLRLLLDLLTIQIVKSDLTRFYTCQLQISDIINISCILQDRRNIRCDIGFSILHTQDHRAVFSRYKDLFRIITEHHCQRIGTTDTHHGMTHCLNRRSAVFLVVIIHQLHSNLRICGRIKRISPAEKLLLQLLVILDTAVMHSCHISVITDMRMGIDL